MVNGDYEIIKLSDFFDEKWYSQKYLNGKTDDPIKHYIDIGCKNNYNPSPHFDTLWYLEEHPDVKMGKKNENDVLNEFNYTFDIN